MDCQKKNYCSNALSWNLVHSKPPTNLVHSKPPRKTVPLRKEVVKQQSAKYDFLLNEKTMSFCIFPKESQKEHSETLVVQRQKAKPKAHANVAKPNSELKNSTTH